jgi:hypothetical protein
MNGNSVRTAESKDDLPGGHARIRVRWSDECIPFSDGEWLLKVLENRVRAGERIRPGELVQVGFVAVKAREADDGLLDFDEPDFRSFPVRWKPLVDNCLLYARRQRDIVDSVSPPVPVNYPSLEQGAFVCAGYSASSTFVIEREVPKDRFSGWFITCDDPDDPHDLADLRLTSLYEIALTCPFIALFLALPAGCAGCIGPAGTELYHGDVKLEISPGSFLSMVTGGTNGKKL